jgi:hypothetical protein
MQAWINVFSKAGSMHVRRIVHAESNKGIIRINKDAVALGVVPISYDEEKGASSQI